MEKKITLELTEDQFNWLAFTMGNAYARMKNDGEHEWADKVHSLWGNMLEQYANQNSTKS